MSDSINEWDVSFLVFVGLSVERKTDKLYLFSTKDSDTCFFAEMALPLMNSQ